MSHCSLIFANCSFKQSIRHRCCFIIMSYVSGASPTVQMSAVTPSSSYPPASPQETGSPVNFYKWPPEPEYIVPECSILSCYRGVIFRPTTSHNVNTMCPIYRGTFWNKPGPTAVSDNGITVQLSPQAMAMIQAKYDEQQGKAFRVKLSKVSCCVFENCCACCACTPCCATCHCGNSSVVSVQDIYFGEKHQDATCDSCLCTGLVRMLGLSCFLCCCEETIQLTIRDIAVIGAPHKQLMH